MSGPGNVYGEALYDLAKGEGLSDELLEQLNVLDEGFQEQPLFLRLLALPNLSKQERCAILDGSFAGKVHPYVLNFLKILMAKGYSRHFGSCCAAYREHYNQDNGILPVTVVTAVPLQSRHAQQLISKLQVITGKKIRLTNRVDSAILGGIRLDYSGKRLDDTVAHRLEAVRALLKNTVL